MAKIVDGKSLAQVIANQLKKEVDLLKQAGIQPRLVIVGNKPDSRSQVYIRMKLKRAEEVGVQAEFIDLNNASHSECQEIVDKLSADSTVHGIIIQLPLSGWYDPQDLIDCIDPQKDVDGLTSASQDALENGRLGLRPATPLAVLEILKSCKVELKNKTITIIGRSHLVGLPLRYMLEQAGAKVLVGHRQVKNLTELTLQSDIVISAAGSPGLITDKMIKKDAIIIDVGINDVDGKLKGDVEFDCVKEIASIITPVPGGVGPLTVVMLLQNVINSAKKMK